MATNSDPLLTLIVVLGLCLVAVCLGYFATIRFGKAGGEKEEAAFGLGQAAIFGMIALILGFSFSFAAERFEARRALVVSEADLIGDAYLRSDFLPTAQRSAFHRTMIDYTKVRLETYAAIGDRREEQRLTEDGKLHQDRLWAIATSDAKKDPRNLFYQWLADSINETMDASELQAAALNNHIPTAIMGIVLLSTLVGAALLGMTFGRAKMPNIALSVVFCILFAGIFYTIVDLDHPQGGFIHVDVAPLQATLEEMRP